VYYERRTVVIQQVNDFHQLAARTTADHQPRFTGTLARETSRRPLDDELDIFN
jgi:hypothetical protein